MSVPKPETIRRYEVHERLVEDALAMLRPDSSLTTALGHDTAVFARMLDQSFVPNMRGNTVYIPGGDDYNSPDALPILPVYKDEKIALGPSFAKPMDTQVQNGARQLIRLSGGQLHAVDAEDIVATFKPQEPKGYPLDRSDWGAVRSRLVSLTDRQDLSDITPGAVALRRRPLVLLDMGEVDSPIDPSVVTLFHEVKHAQQALTEPLVLSATRDRDQIRAELQARQTGAHCVRYMLSQGIEVTDDEDDDKAIDDLRIKHAHPADPYALTPPMRWDFIRYSFTTAIGVTDLEELPPDFEFNYEWLDN